MNQPSHQAKKYDFLLALNVGESMDFPNMPTRSEAMRHVSPSNRSAYTRISQAATTLRRLHPDHVFKVELANSKGSRIEGNIVRITLLARGSEVSSDDDLRKFEEVRQRRIESWRKRKIAQEAPLLPRQLAEAEEAERKNRIEAAAKSLRVIPNRFDPKRIAEMAVAFANGEIIEKLVDGRWLIDQNPTWQEPTGHYRIKPKVREWFLVIGRDRLCHAFAETIEQLPHHDPNCRVRVREVIEEDV